MKKRELIKWRTDHKLTQEELGGLLGVAGNTVSRWENGMRKMPSFLKLALSGLQIKTEGKVK